MKPAFAQENTSLCKNGRMFKFSKSIMSEQFSYAENMAMKAVTLSAFSSISLTDIKSKNRVCDKQSRRKV